jgi:hypothetical protein
MENAPNGGKNRATRNNACEGAVVAGQLDEFRQSLAEVDLDRPLKDDPSLDYAGRWSVGKSSH